MVQTNKREQVTPGKPTQVHTSQSVGLCVVGLSVYVVGGGLSSVQCLSNTVVLD